MKAVVQRVKNCQVWVNGEKYSEIGNGILILLAVHKNDNEEDAKFLADRCSALRIFEDGSGKMNLSVRDISGSAMVVSEFTLYGDARKGNRPNYMDAAKPELAEPLYNYFTKRLEEIMGNGKVATGVFRTMMDVKLVNDGPVTIIVETGDEVR
jgi:D-tyrosyl-tRNA(Tyr) deacylase